MGNEIVLKKKAQATAPYWNRGARQSYVGRFRYPNYVGKDLATLNVDTLGERTGNTGDIVYPPTMNGSSYLENKRKEIERQVSFLQKKTATFYPFRRSLLHVGYSLHEQRAFPFSAVHCFASH